MIRRSHDRWRCPKCRFTGLFPPALQGMPVPRCPRCATGTAMLKVAAGSPDRWQSRPLRPPP